MSDNEQVDTSQENTEEVSAADTLYPDGKETTEEVEAKPEGEETSQEEATEPEKGEEESKGEEQKTEEGEVQYELSLSEKTLLDESVKDEIVSIAKEQGLSNEVAQKILSMQEKIVSSYQADIENDLKEEVSGWYDEIVTDKELGGDHLDTNVRIAKDVVKHFGGDEFLEELNNTGYANHPRLFKLLVGVGKEMKAGGLVLAGAQPDKPVNAADVFYPTTKQN